MRRTIFPLRAMPVRDHPIVLMVPILSNFLTPINADAARAMEEPLVVLVVLLGKLSVVMVRMPRVVIVSIW